MVGGKNILYPNLHKCLTENPFWCSCPYTHLNISTLGKYRPCCSAQDLNETIFNTSISEHFNSPDMSELRKDLENRTDSNIKQHYCNKCLFLEERNVNSKRKRLNGKLLKDISNNTNPEYLTTLEKILTDSLDDKPIDVFSIKFRSLELEIFGNLCNLKCMMCRSEKSSTFDSVIVNPYIEISSNVEFMDELYTLMEQTPLVKITGGEVVINKSFIFFLQHLIDIGLAQHLTIEFVSNGTVFSPTIGKLLPQFKDVNICISVDGVGQINDFQRRYSSFEILDQTINKYKQYIDPTKLLLLGTISPLNCSRVEELYLYSVSKGISLNMSCNVIYPPEYNISILPDEIRQLYLDKLLQSKYKKNFVNTIKFLQNGKYDKELFYKYLKDILSNYDSDVILSYFPEYKKYILEI